ncbi:MAG: restriction endonuclease [Clostridia bacterium]|jgi:site-specific DNA-methyltransferase (adenine-specific)|nr:restriction endonuclease [Clostridia bacterium]
MIKKQYNPDVLSCLANLSNDEVFTPPELANSMLDLLPQELFKNPNMTFLDPACKSGVFLREIAKRLIAGLKDEIPDEQERINHIFTKQLFGISITEMTGMLSRRSVYCTKHANGKYSVCTKFKDEHGNIIFNNVKHTFKDGRCVFCGASQTEYDRGEELESHAYQFIHTLNAEEIFKMKFDVIISNPPYQLSDGGGTGSSAMPIYQYFVEAAIKLAPRYVVMITPSRWFAGGKGLDDFRDKMLKSEHISTMIDYANSADCFPGVIIAGGVNYFLWEREYSGKCLVVNKKGEQTVSAVLRSLNENEVFVRDNLAIEIIRKIKAVSKTFIDSIVSSRNSFNIISKEEGHKDYYKDDYILFSLKGKSFISREAVTDRDNLVDKYKVIMTKAMSGGNKPSSDGSYLVISNTFKVLSPGDVCTETYLCLGCYTDYEKAKNLKQYLATKFFRFLLLQALTSINISKEKFLFVPIQDFTDNSDIYWWQSINDIDKQLYKKYNLTQEEINFIESMIRPMEG